MNDKEKPAFHHAERYETRLRVAGAVVSPFNGEDVFEHVARHLEADAMVPPVKDGFCIIPFESFIVYMVLHSSSFVKRPEADSFACQMVRRACPRASRVAGQAQAQVLEAPVTKRPRLSARAPHSSGVAPEE